ncbi:hypothetical protein Pla22_17930 [Rubripirellula amarantea]|uniref:LamG-like jellyroll fold domain-containing protein n=1 Tax=Rubripirellula amarantea TaxID=2527999 RepID=A0A5C5WU95_9BACT|nr:LamG domain-containing protein [Rubripirellula amarantea]TWT54158.1 hypothetical protein Pla22_17930 [Rubripirellula amarantea]
MKTTQIWACLGAVLFCWGAMSPTCQAALVAHWTGDGTANDASGNGHHGTLHDDTTFATGVIGDAFLFDGNNDYVSIPNALTLEPSTITIAAFVKMGDTGQSQRLVVDSSHGFGDFAGWALQTDPGGTIAFVYGNGSSFFGVGSTTVIDDDQFHHVAGVLDGNTLSIYIDGSFEDSSTLTGTPMASGRELRIGASYGGNSSGSVREVNGLIDDVRLYDQALNSNQIMSLAVGVPEPSTTVALCLGVLATVTWRYKRRLPS